MKRDEIKVGESYSNGRGRVRKAVDVGPQYRLYSGQADGECLCYEVVKDGSKKNLTAGKRYNMTISSFAAWAKSKARIAFIEDVIREHKAGCCELPSWECPYCAGFDDESCQPVYEGYGLKVMIDGSFMYFFLNSGYKQVFEIDFCPKCGANLRE